MIYVDQAIQSLLYEAALTPKPGLVDAQDRGSHNDMDIFTFIDSALALRESFEAYYRIGLQETLRPQELFNAIRTIGLQAEAAMYKATNNINTHKGANFSFGVVLAAMGACHRDKHYDLKTIRNYIMSMTEGLVDKELRNLKSYQSHGENMFADYGITGIRGEVEQGFPLIFNYALPYYQNHPELKETERLLKTLLVLMAHNDDSNILKRGGIEALHYTKKEALRLIESHEIAKDINILNQDFVKQNLSPGGSADLLALTHFLANYTKMLHLD